MLELPPALAGLAPYAQFICYKLAPGKVPGKMDKKPVSPLWATVCDPTDPSNWGTFRDAAMMASTGAVDGIGFVFTEKDPFWFLDIDNALQGNQWSAVAQDLMNRTAGAAIEVSQSGTGLHIIGSGAIPPHGCKAPGGLELYHKDRFVALTGKQSSGDVRHDCSHALPSIVAQYFTRQAGGGEWDDWTDHPVPEWDGHTDDQALIDHAMRAGSKATAAAAFGGHAKATFADLWNANGDVLAEVWPDTGRAYDASRADAALAQHLAFWTGNDCARIERLMRQSALVRDKWDHHATYIYMTVMAACRNQTQWHRLTRTEPARQVEAGELIAGARIMTPDMQLEHFAGCVYVRDLHRVLTPDGALLKPDQFKAMYGGYVFTMDTNNQKSTRNAWEAFTESQAVIFPKVTRTMFRPDLAPGQIFEYEGARRVNGYVPVPTRRIHGDPAPFLRHLELVLPDERDRQILLAYMAACVQHVGVKFQWWPLLQGTEGNGKTLFSRCVAAAIGMQHTASPRAEEVSNKFNSWIKDKLFVYIEDVYYPDHKREIIEALKPIVTNDWLPVEPKGVDQTLEYVVANGMLNSNHRDAIQKTRNDRRYCVFFTAQQSEDDLKRDGMTGGYFPKLYEWLRADGYAIVAHYLATYPIPDELNPAGACDRAPTTSTTEQAIAASLGRVEQEIQEAIDAGRYGFCGGWVSSHALTKLLDEQKLGRMVPLNRRREVMQSLGYDYHPALRDGRVDNIIPGESKPRLFIRAGHIHANLTRRPEVTKAYLAAQAETEGAHWTVEGARA